MKAFRLLKGKLGLSIKSMDISYYIQRFGNKLQLSQRTITRAVEIVTNKKIEPTIRGKHPKSIVASALYVASKLNGEKRTQRQIANATGVIEVTIRKRSREMQEILKPAPIINS